MNFSSIETTRNKDMSVIVEVMDQVASVQSKDSILACTKYVT